MFDLFCSAKFDPEQLMAMITEKQSGFVVEEYTGCRHTNDLKQLDVGYGGEGFWLPNPMRNELIGLTGVAGHSKFLRG